MSAGQSAADASGASENICSLHDRVMEIFCHTDQELLCMFCGIGEHNGHTLIMPTQFRMQMVIDKKVEQLQGWMEALQEKKAELEMLAQSVRDTAWEVCDDFERVCKAHWQIFLVSLVCSEIRERVGAIEKKTLDNISKNMKHLNHEEFELQVKQAACLLSVSDNPTQFFQNVQALGDLLVVTIAHQNMEEVFEFVAAAKNEMREFVANEMKRLFPHFDSMTRLVKVHRGQPNKNITSRRDVLSWCGETKITLDPNTAAENLFVTKKELSYCNKKKPFTSHSDRFVRYPQALCKEGLMGNHYWEVEWDGGIVEVAVSYNSIDRYSAGNNACFGHNEQSWKLQCGPSSCMFWHNKRCRSHIPPVHSRRVGVLLQVSAGKLTFFSVSEGNKLTVLHEVWTTFTEAVFPGFSVDLGATLKICSF